MTQVKLGGQGTAGRVQRREVSSTAVAPVSSIMGDISNIINTATTTLHRKAVARDQEDKLLLHKQALTESQDVTNALQGASYDTDLNNNVEAWRAGGMSETEIRTKAKDYKYGKAIQDFGLDKGEEADDAINGYFETFTELEMKQIEPLAKADRLRVQSEMSDVINSSLTVGTDKLSVRFKDSVEVGKKYNISYKEVSALAITSAFRKAKTGDNRDLEALENIKHKGVRIIDTVEGSALYAKLSDAKDARAEHNEVKEQRAKVKEQVATTDSIYTNIIQGDFEDSKVLLDTSLETGAITMAQHQALTKIWKASSPSQAPTFPEQSDSKTYSKLLAKAHLGTLSAEELEAHKSMLDYTSFKNIASIGMQKGGAFGIGNDQDDIIEDDIKNFAIDNAGIDLTAQINSDLNGLQLGKKRRSLLSRRLREMKNAYVVKHEKLPDDEAWDKLKAKALAHTDKTLGTVDVKGNITAPSIGEKYEDILKSKPSNTADFKAWYRNLTPSQRETYKNKDKAFDPKEASKNLKTVTNGLDVGALFDKVDTSFNKAKETPKATPKATPKVNPMDEALKTTADRIGLKESYLLDESKKETTQETKVSSLEKYIMSNENSKANLKGGYSILSGKWKPHKSLEGGNDTLAYGHKLTDAEKKAGSIYGIKYKDGITDKEAQTIFKKDAQKVSKALEVSNLSAEKQAVVVDVSFRLGVKGTKNTSFLKAMKKGDMGEAYAQTGDISYTTPKGIKKFYNSRNKKIFKDAGLWHLVLPKHKEKYKKLQNKVKD